ncbi:dihydrodipicolinate reductase [Mycobacterium sp. RTGN5]|uniref:NAD(P)H-dependent amine dehydrogenase family protein n=1 Tax=Mycobacterium sp. RTGN5 TaxID=3016522 RepID=UPI0029C87E5A|nr:dihydrodipicolinate reductase [Mycobacterium sp. RTGN5]
MTSESRPRVILWGPGHVGVTALRALIEHPGLELVGVVVYSEDKRGRDAGDLCGLPTTGVIATSDVDAALAVDADAVAYFASGDFRYHDAAQDIARCLRAGKNVVTTALVPMCYPPAADEETVLLLQQACADGGTSVYNSGIDPGWSNDVVPLTIAGLSSRVDTITMLEVLDYQEVNQPEVMFDLMGFARPPDSKLPMDEARLERSWGPVLRLLAAGLGLSLDSIETCIERWVTPERYEVAAGWIEAGTTGGIRFELAGMVNGEKRIVVEHITRMGEHSAPEWPRHPSPRGGYRIIVEGLPTYTVDLAIEAGGDTLFGLTYGSVSRQLNAIPAVIAAPTGVLSSLDLPLITGPVRGGSWHGVLPKGAS